MGGGGSSGEADWPNYMKESHNVWLTEMEDDSIPEMQALNPFTAAAAFDPTSDLALAWAAVCEFDAFVDALSHESDWTSAMSAAETVVDNLIDTTYIDADVNAYADVIDDQLNDTVLPQFKSGMRDVNAVMSSAFVLGEADIYAKRTRDVAKYASDLRLKSNYQRNEMVMKGADTMLQNLMTAAQYEGEVSRQNIEAKRVTIVASKEWYDKDLEIDEQDARWDNEALMYGAKMLASISGGSGPVGGKPSDAQSALGGAVAGAGLGAQLTGGNPAGIAVGGALGALGGLLFN